MAKVVRARAGMRQLAKLVAGDLGRGEITAGLESVGSALASSPEAVLAVLDLLLAERRKTRPGERLIDALLFMLGEALRESRLAQEGGAPEPARTLIAGVRDRIVAMTGAERLAPDLLLALAQLFVSAGLDPGDDLRVCLQTEVAAPADGAAVDPADLAAQYGALAAALRDDPFLIHGQLSEQLALLAEAQRAAIVASLVDCDVPAMRDAALGWLLDPSPGMAENVAQRLAAAAADGRVSAAGLARMALMRPWVAPSVQAGIDRAVRAGRARGIDAGPTRTAAQVAVVIASGCDGTGAQTLLALTKRGRTLALAALLVKHGVGLRDAWVSDGLSRREADGLRARISAELDPFDASPEIVETMVAYALADGLAQGTPPPFGLVQVIEALGLSPIRPQRRATEDLVAELLDAVPAERRSAQAVAAALAASRGWPRRYAFPTSWFEVDGAVRAVADATGGGKAFATAMLESVLPERRQHWATRLAWTALAARDAVEDEAWIDFALVARELLGERPLARIPVATWIARNTAAALTRR